MSPAVERGQSVVELVAVVPMCVICALAIVDAGAVVQDRIATVHAATRAAEAELVGADEKRAAQGALPRRLRAGVRVHADGERVEVTTTSRPMVLRVPGGIDHRSVVELDDSRSNGVTS